MLPSQTQQFWQYLVLLLVLTASVIGLACHFFPSLKKRSRHAFGRLLSRAYMPKFAQQYAARHLLAQPTTQCGCCSGCSSAPPPDAKITLIPRRKSDTASSAGHAVSQR